MRLPGLIRKPRPPRLDAEQLRRDPAGLGGLGRGAAAPPVSIRVDRRARRLAIRVDPRTRAVKLTVPTHARPETVLGFVRAHTGWVAARLEALGTAVPFAEGSVLPILGEPVTIETAPGIGIVRDGDRLRVGGDPAFLARRVGDWLKREARRTLSDRTAAMAARLGTRATAVSVRDTVSRWGSCSAGGRISYSWRLILAPDWVADYVVAHEVAHLVELNHSPRFWRLVGDLVGDIDPARRWLKRHGPALHRYGGDGTPPLADLS